MVRQQLTQKQKYRYSNDQKYSENQFLKTKTITIGKTTKRNKSSVGMCCYIQKICFLKTKSGYVR